MNRAVLAISFLLFTFINSSADTLIKDDSATIQARLIGNRALKISDIIKFEMLNNSGIDLKIISSAVRYKLYHHDSLILDNGLVLMDLFCPNMEVVSKMICVHQLKANAEDTIEVCLFKELNSLAMKSATTLELYIDFKAFYDEMDQAKDTLYFIDTLKVVYIL